MRQLDLGKAKRFLDDLVQAQQEAGTASQHIVKTLCNVGSTAFSAGFADWAEDLYRQADRLGAEDPVARTGLAEVLKAQDKFGEAEQLYRETSERWPNDVVARNGLAAVLKAQDRFGEAEQLYRETSERWPQNVVARNGLAEVLKAQDKFGEAEQLYRETSERWPQNVVARNGLAEVLKAQDKFGEAEQLYRETGERWPQNVVARTGLAEVLKAQDKFGEAEQLYRETSGRWPQNVVARTGLAEVLKAQGKIGEAEDLYRETIQIWPNNRVASHGLANLLRKRRAFDEALELLPVPQAINVERDHYDVHLRGMIQLEAGDVSRAIDLLQRGLRAARTEKRRAVYRRALAIARLREERYEDAYDELRQAPRNPENEILQLHAMAGLGNASEAQKLHDSLSARILTFRKPVLTSIERVAKAWGLPAPGAIRRPTPAELADVYEAEVEMLLAA